MNRICIGRIASAHGVKGLVKVFPLVDDLTLFTEVFTSETGPETLNITLKNQLGKYILAEIEGVNDRNAAEALGKCPFFAEDENASALPQTPYEDLIGKPVINAAGEPIGIVKGVENYGASDLLDISLTNGKSVMVPLTPDFVPEIGETLKIVDYEAFL
ncbi:MAG: 16S rRNA processing protein RimM [Alphaproteobacteria bacterium]|nr:16S rRNA processing protein RimM [Alphaproteobacteria bacterium]